MERNLILVASVPAGRRSVGRDKASVPCGPQEGLVASPAPGPPELTGLELPVLMGLPWPDLFVVICCCIYMQILTTCCRVN